MPTCAGECRLVRVIRVLIFTGARTCVTSVLAGRTRSNSGRDRYCGALPLSSRPHNATAVSVSKVVLIVRRPTMAMSSAQRRGFGVGGHGDDHPGPGGPVADRPERPHVVMLLGAGISEEQVPHHAYSFYMSQFLRTA